MLMITDIIVMFFTSHVSELSYLVKFSYVSELPYHFELSYVSELSQYVVIGWKQLSKRSTGSDIWCIENNPKSLMLQGTHITHTKTTLN